ncbi:UNVERIFIED_CONTAM: Retrovirus-related Pol polyprotein from transposon TNT 1-94 [Sesamum radiatum]|uniref:Retrovirus-related Pol polyprotein from transposon TNT 1-94 n=1 Tax=Sesamum radiatum TaxID=300843 RepID=A0AAW2V834_SESRA
MRSLNGCWTSPYASAIGSIQYVVQCTKPDLAVSFRATSQYQACAREAHWNAVKTIIKYLKMTKDMSLIYGGGELIMEAYSDATMADSTIEFEYIAASEAAKEAVWMKNYIQKLGVVPSITEPVVIFFDNNGVIAQTKELISHHRSKHNS